MKPSSMIRECVIIGGKIYPVETDTQEKLASRKLSEAGINSARVWRSGVETRLVLLADTDVDPLENGTRR